MREILLNEDYFIQLRSRFEKAFSSASEGAKYAGRAEAAMKNSMLSSISSFVVRQKSDDMRRIMDMIVLNFTETDKELAKQARRIGEQYIGPGRLRDILEHNEVWIRDGLIHSDDYQDIIAQMGKEKVDYKPFRRLNSVPSDEEIIARVGADDETEGSCVSVAFAYIGNKAGYDVLDYRGGGSRSVISLNNNIHRIAEFPGVNSTIVSGTNDVECANNLLSEMIPGRQYFLRTGRHGAIVRNNGGRYEYLELQSPTNNGWHTLDDNELVRRFDCQVRTEEMKNDLIDIESLYDSDDFIDMLGYINTDAQDQVVGR